METWYVVQPYSEWSVRGLTLRSAVTNIGVTTMVAVFVLQQSRAITNDEADTFLEIKLAQLGYGLADLQIPQDNKIRLQSLPRSATKTQEDAAKLKVAAETALTSITFTIIRKEHPEAEDITWYKAT